MNINGLGSLGGTGATVGAANGGNLGQEQFLELLLVQMQNQSPLDPMDSQQFLAQLAQFSTLEQLAGVNAGIDNLAFSQAGMVAGQIVTMIGKDVTYPGNELQLADGEGNLKFELDRAAESVRVSIRNENGTVVRVVELGSRSSGVNEYGWNGKDDAGNAQPPGTYTFEVEALDQAGEKIRNETFSTGRVNGVTYVDGTPQLIIGDTKQSPADILEITEAQERDEP